MINMKTAKINKVETSLPNPFFSIIETNGSKIRDKRIEIATTINRSDRR
jgi:hypothetical protein